MKKFIRLSVINKEWCRKMAKASDIKFVKMTFFKKKCELCDARVNRKLYKYENSVLGTEFVQVHYFCSNCLLKQASETKKVVNVNRLLADYVNLTLNKDLFIAKSVQFRKSDILSVEGAAYDQSTVRFNGATTYDGHPLIRVRERKSEIMKILGETISLRLSAPNSNDKSVQHKDNSG